MGYDEGGQLTEAVRRKPYSVVLFDEIEKAHPDVFNVLLQVLDDGRITDSQGRTVDFKNTILIMTSNIGSAYLLDGIDENGNIRPEAEELVMNDLRNHFRPEFLNRLDETIMFRPLTRDNIHAIIKLLVDDVNKRLADKEIRIELTENAKQIVVEGGYDPTYGARPLKRYLQKNVETPGREADPGRKRRHRRHHFDRWRGRTSGRKDQAASAGDLIQEKTDEPCHISY